MDTFDMIATHPASDAWMRGIRYIIPTSATRNLVRGTHPMTGARVSVPVGDVMPHPDYESLSWVIHAPRVGAIDETFAPTHADALAWARELHGGEVWVALDIETPHHH